jgi:hypothetical protein
LALAGILRLELACLELDDEIAVQPNVVEEQIEVESVVPNHEWHLAADEGEATAEFEQQIPEMDE